MACGCGDDHDTETIASVAVYEANSTGRIEVAAVNGVPVYADCVEDQAEGLGIDKDQALEQCIDFELLAQAARREGYLSHPSVVETSRVESVRALIEHSYPLTSADRIPDGEIRHFWDERGLERKFNHPEGREAKLCVAMEDKGGVTPEVDAENKQIIGDVYAQMQTVDPADPESLKQVCEAKASEVKASGRDVRYIVFSGTRERFLKEFAEPLWKLTEVGLYSGPHHAPPGWFVVQLAAISPARSAGFEDAKKEIADALMTSKDAMWWRMGKFAEWYNKLAEKHTVEVFPERMPVGGL